MEKAAARNESHRSADDSSRHEKVDDRRKEAEDLLERTGKAVAFGMRHCGTDLATFLDSLPMPERDTDKADKIADATDVYIRALSWMAAYTYGLCLMLRKDVREAGEYFRRDDVQQELRDRAMRAAITVMSKP